MEQKNLPWNRRQHIYFIEKYMDKKTSKLLLLLSVIAFSSLKIFSQSLNIEHLDEPGSGRIYSLVSDNKNNLYAYAENSGIYKYEIKNNKWAKIISEKTATGLLLASNKAGNIFVAIPTKVMLRSIDEGKTFQVIGQGVEGKTIKSLIIDSNNIVYVSTDDNAVYRSKDNGGYFEKVFVCSKILYNSMTVNSKGYVYIGVNYPDKLYRSTDSGDSWQEVVDSVMNGSIIDNLKFDKKDRLYLCTQTKGILRFDENDKNLKPINSGLAEYWIETVSFDNLGNIYAGSANRGIFKSSFDGNSWIQLGEEFHMLSSTADGNGDVYFGAYDVGVIKINKTTSGLNYVNNGMNALEITDFAFDNDYIFVSMSSDVICRYTKNLFNWLYINLKRGPTRKQINYLCSMKDKLYSGSSSGLYVTEKNKFGQYESDYYVIKQSVFNLKSFNDRIYFPSYTGLYEYDPVKDSTVLLGFPNIPVFDMDINSKGWLYVINWMERDVYISTDRGLNWQSCVKPNVISSLNKIHVDSHNNIYVLVDPNIVIYSHDNGQTWETIPNDNSGTITAFYIDKRDNLLLGYDNGTILCSSNKGKSWSKIESSLINSEITVFKEDPDGNIFFGTHDMGIFKIKINTLLVEKTLELPSKINLKQNFPNPFNPSTTIQYDVLTPGLVKIVILDVYGREIEILVNKPHASGSYSVNWNPVNKSSGVYYYKLSSANQSDVKKMLYLK